MPDMVGDCTEAEYGEAQALAYVLHAAKVARWEARKARIVKGTPAKRKARKARQAAKKRLLAVAELTGSGAWNRTKTRLVPSIDWIDHARLVDGTWVDDRTGKPFRPKTSDEEE
ncbi:MAG: hypothetical protein GY838_13535 [bacterium]|nr:hypothetical protein [bacterium]